MVSVCHLLALLALAVTAAGSRILSPASVAKELDTPYNNKYLSSNFTISHSGFNTTMVLWRKGHSCPNQQIEDEYKGRLVVVSDGVNGWTFDELRQACNCVNAAGGAAMMIRFTFPGPQSLFFRLHYDTRESPSHPCPIPMLGSRDTDTSTVYDLLRDRSENVTIFVQATTNPWNEMFDSAALLVILRILLPIANGIGAIVALAGATSHTRFVLDSKADKVIPWMILGLCFEFIGCTIRTVYLAVGPIYSNKNFTYVEHSYLVNITSPFEIITTTVAVIVFRQWTAFGRRQQVGRLGKVLFGLLVILVFALEIASGNARAHLSNGVYFTYGSAIIYIPIILFSSSLFLYRGTRFYLTLKGSFDNANKNRALSKAIRWLMVSGTSSLFLLASYAFMVTKYFLTPWPSMVIFIFLNSSLTSVSLSHVFAFYPQNRRKIAVSVTSRPKAAL